MAKFEAISENDTYELRKELDLPIAKPLRYMRHIIGSQYESTDVIDYVIAETYQPSGMHCLKITLTTGEEIKILASYFAHMQKPSFIKDMANGKEI